jgi:hypothetical protein
MLEECANPNVDLGNPSRLFCVFVWTPEIGQDVFGKKSSKSELWLTAGRGKKTEL